MTNTAQIIKGCPPPTVSVPNLKSEVLHLYLNPVTDELTVATGNTSGACTVINVLGGGLAHYTAQCQREGQRKRIAQRHLHHPGHE